ncbi:Arm DNA-binding domain-containing protein [Bacteroides fragilis]
MPIMCRITVNGTITSFSCKLNVKPKQWNVKAGRHWVVMLMIDY